MNISLVSMPEDEFKNYTDIQIVKYAKEKHTGEGYCEEDALRIAEATYNSLLPEGLDTPNHFLFNIIETIDQTKLGTLWFAHKIDGKKEYAFVYNIEISEGQRGRGIGKEVLKLLEIKVKELNLNIISLHVFAHNKVAHKLYEKSGYQVTNIIMSKTL